MNPPFGARNGLVPWLRKFFAHGNGIALVPDRTSAPWWQEFAPQADMILFVAPKLKFIDEMGNPGTSPAQGTCLLGAGQQAMIALCRAEKKGLGTILLTRARTTAPPHIRTAPGKTRGAATNATTGGSIAMECDPHRQPL